MTRAVKPLRFRSRDHRTGEMRAFLSVGHELIRGDTYKHAGITRIGIMEKLRASNWELIHAGDVFKRRLTTDSTQSAQEHNPRLAHDKGQAGDHHELGEITAGAIIVLWRVNRELLPPVRLLLRGLVIRRYDFRPFRFHFPSPAMSMPFVARVSSSWLPTVGLWSAATTSRCSTVEPTGTIMLTFVLMI